VLNNLILFCLKAVEVNGLMQLTVIDIIGSIIFGETFGALQGNSVELLNEIRNVVVELGKYKRNFFNHFKSKATTRQYFNSIKTTQNKIIKHYINKRRNDPKRADKFDILNLLLNTIDEGTEYNISDEKNYIPI